MKKGSPSTVFYDLYSACKKYIIYLKSSEPSKNISKTIVTEYIVTNSEDFGFMVYPNFIHVFILGNFYTAYRASDTSLKTIH